MKSINKRLPRSTRDHAPCLSAAIVAACALILFSSTAAPTITTRHGGSDGGELAAVALSGGVAHPSGYPTYLLLARLALMVPVGEAAARLAWLSAVCGALAATLTAALVTWTAAQTDRSDSRTSTLAGLFAGFSLMASPRFWSQAVIVEVYTLHLLWLVLCAFAWLAWLRSGATLWIMGAMLCFGLGLGTHLTLGMIALAAALTLLGARQRPPVTPAVILASCAAFLVGASVYGLLPIWAAREAAPSWGDASNLPGWWRHVSGSEYRYLIGVVPWEQRWARLGFAGRDLLMQPGPIGLLLALWLGVPYGWRRQRPLIVLSGTVALSSLVFAIGYGGEDGTVYLLPWSWAWCVWAGLGTVPLLQSLGERRWLVAGMLLVLLVLLIGTVSVRYDQIDLHADTRERDRIIAHLQSLDRAALLFSADDATTFGVWYVQRALNIRTDISVIDQRLLQQSWYRAQIRRQLGLADQPAICQQLHALERSVYIAESAGQWRYTADAPWLNDQGCSVLPDGGAAVP